MRNRYYYPLCKTGQDAIRFERMGLFLGGSTPLENVVKWSSTKLLQVMHAARENSFRLLDAAKYTLGGGGVTVNLVNKN